MRCLSSYISTFNSVFNFTVLGMYCIEETLLYLEKHKNLTAELKKCHIFNKLSSSNKFGDLVCVRPIRLISNEEILHKELQHLIEECQKDIRASVVNFTLNNNKIYLKLNRLSTIKSIFTDIFECHSIYGCSNKLFNKTFRLCLEDCDNELTQMRMRRAGRVVSELIALGGGSVTDTADARIIVLSTRPGPPPSIQVGPVHIAGSTDTSLTNYLQLRRAELESSDHKGLSEQMVEELVNASVVFDLLSVKLVKPLMLNSSIRPSSATRSNCKDATFVIYNYARVCAILNRFEGLVSKKVHRPLPSYLELDYNLLSKEEEWRLMFNFLAEWPSVVTECLDFEQPKLQNIVIFLSSFASTFSVFYKYNRVINDGLEHMLPLMEARIHLMTAIQKVFLVAFSVLGINSPTKM